MSVHNDKGSWFCKWLEDGKEKRKYFGSGDIAKHQAQIFDEEQKRQRGKLRVEGGLTVAEICQQYHSQHPVESSTASTDFYRLDRIILPAVGNLQAEALSSQQLNGYVQERLKAGRKRRTIARELDLLRSALNWAASQDPPLILRNPVAKFRIPGARDSDVPSPPTIEEVGRILRHAQAHLVRALCLEWSLGLRPGGEVSRIRWSDVDLAGNKIRVVGARKGGPGIRYIPIPDAEHSNLREDLVRWRDEDIRAAGEEQDSGEIPVVHFRLKAVESLKRSWATAKRKAGITRRLRLYDLRHAMATYALEGGADLKAVSEILGHSRADTTLRFYQHVLKDQHRQAVNKIPKIPSHIFLTSNSHTTQK
ncbi:MAG: tyrosine-type recombinase/integrase [Syntrophobacteraceae bacterium]